MWALVVCFVAVTLYWSHHVDIPIKDPHGSMFVSRVGISLGLFVPMALIDATLRVGRRGWSVRRTVEMLRLRWTKQRLLLAASALLAYHVVYVCYHNLKSWDVLNSPARRHAAGLGPVAVPRAQPRRCCCTTCSGSTPRRTC